MDNLLVKHEGSAAPMTFSHDAASRPVSFSHDAASRPVSFLQGSGVTTYSWANRGTVFQEARPDGVVTTFQQSEIRNQLVYAQLSSGTNSSYSYDSDGMRLRTFEGSVWSTMVWDQGDYLAVNRSGADDSLFVLMDGEVLGEILGSEARDYLADPLGSVRGGFDSSQDLQDAMSYWPYGEPLPASRTWGTLFWLGALGYYQDPGSRVYVRARSYSTNSASWLQVDPLWPGEPGFGYVGGMPVAAVDPSGMWTAKPGKEIVDCARGMIGEKCTYTTGGGLACVEVFSKCAGIKPKDIPQPCNHPGPGRDCPRSTDDVCNLLKRKGLYHKTPWQGGKPCKSGDMVCFGMSNYRPNAPCGGHCGVISQVDRLGRPTKVIMCSSQCNPPDTVCELDLSQWLQGCRSGGNKCWVNGCGGAK